MAMRNFRHVNAASIAHASELTADGAGKAVVIAGGTDLLGALKDNIHAETPELLVNLKLVGGLRTSPRTSAVCASAR